MSKSTLLLTILLLALFPQTQPQPTSIISLQAPAHIYRIQSYQAGLINITLTWNSNQTSSSTYLTMCLFNGGQYFDSSSCRGLLTRTGLKSIILGYDASGTNAYFLRVGCLGSWGNQMIKYTISISTSAPQYSATYTVGYDVSDPSKIIRYFSSTSILKRNYQKLTIITPTSSNQLRTQSFNTYNPITFTSDTIFNLTFKSPSITSQFTQLPNQQKCFKTTQNTGVFIITLLTNELYTPYSTISDTTILNLQIGVDNKCYTSKVTQSVQVDKTGVIVGSVIGSVAGCCFLVVYCCCCFGKSSYDIYWKCKYDWGCPQCCYCWFN